MLKKLWQKSYEHNMAIMIPHIADKLNRGFLSLSGVKVQGR